MFSLMLVVLAFLAGCANNPVQYVCASGGSGTFSDSTAHDGYRWIIKTNVKALSDVSFALPVGITSFVFSSRVDTSNQPNSFEKPDTTVIRWQTEDQVAFTYSRLNSYLYGYKIDCPHVEWWSNLDQSVFYFCVADPHKVLLNWRYRYGL